MAPRKSLCLVPEMFAIRMVYELGFVLRQKIVWAKKVLLYKEMETVGNAMPESVKSRNTHTYEIVYHFAKEPDHYYNQLRLPYKQETLGRMERARRLIERTGLPITENNKYYEYIRNGEVNSLGLAGVLTGRFLKQMSLDGEVINESIMDEEENDIKYTKAEKPSMLKKVFSDLHLKGERHDKKFHPLGANAPDVIQICTEPNPEAHFASFPTKLVEFLISVGCPESGIVLDPFLGSGTTALVALKMGRNFVGIEVCREYCEITKKRIQSLLSQQKLSTE